MSWGRCAAPAPRRPADRGALEQTSLRTCRGGSTGERFRSCPLVSEHPWGRSVDHAVPAQVLSAAHAPARPLGRRGGCSQ
jgi:hypothetical protein